MGRLTDLVSARRGHFLLESGFHGSLWLDLEPLIDAPERIAPMVKELAARLRRYEPSAVCGPATGGAALAQSLADELGVAAYSAVKEPRSDTSGLFTATYRVEVDDPARLRGVRVALVDDVISAGSSVRATHAALRSHGAETCAVGTLLTLGDRGREFFTRLGIPVEALEAEGYELWAPRECPRCASGVPLINPQGSINSRVTRSQ